MPSRRGSRRFFYARSISAGESAAMAGMPVQVFDQDHGFTRSLGLRIGGFAYSTDVVGLDAAVLEGLAGVHTWLVDCFQRAPHKTHAHLELVLHWSERVRPVRTILTHMGIDMDWAWLRANLPPGVEPAYDGMRLVVP
jgi:phosphoribosyl 1,2-cyclic phosphate phosphodiesterase